MLTLFLSQLVETYFYNEERVNAISFNLTIDSSEKTEQDNFDNFTSRDTNSVNLGEEEEEEEKEGKTYLILEKTHFTYITNKEGAYHLNPKSLKYTKIDYTPPEYLS